MTIQSISATEAKTTQRVFNYLGKAVSISSKVRGGCLDYYNYSDNRIIDIVNTYSYDLNGNMINERVGIDKRIYIKSEK